MRLYSQPVGGIASFIFEGSIADFIKENVCLCIDPGFNTVDWAILDCSKVMRTMNDSVQAGMVAYLTELQNGVRRKYPNMTFNTTHALDADARGEKPLNYGATLIDISAEAAAPIFQRALLARYPDIAVRASDGSPILANAKGFFVMGRNAWHSAAAAGSNLPAAAPKLAPTASPMTETLSPCTIIMARTSCGDAPSAVRIPISRVRCVTE